MQRKFIALLFLPLLATLCYVAYFWSSAEAALRQSIEDLAREASFGETKEHPLESLKAVRQVLEYFAIDPVLEVSLSSGKQFSINSKKELSNRITAMRKMLSRFELHLEIKELSITQPQAEFELVATALGAMPGVEGSFFEAHLLRVVSTNESGRWQIQRIEQLKNLREEELTVDSVKKYFSPGETEVDGS